MIFMITFSETKAYLLFVSLSNKKKNMFCLFYAEDMMLTVLSFTNLITSSDWFTWFKWRSPLYLYCCMQINNCSTEKLSNDAPFFIPFFYWLAGKKSDLKHILLSLCHTYLFHHLIWSALFHVTWFLGNLLITSIQHCLVY